MIPTPESADSLFEELLGEQFDGGMHRIVHDVKGFPDLVIKVSKDSTFANWCEYLVSTALRGRPEPVAGLVGSVESISATGRYLIMERLIDINRPLSGIQYPVWLNDGFKRSTYGITASGEVKVRDCGTLKLTDVLAKYNPKFDDAPPTTIVPSGHDQDYADLQGDQIGSDAGRAIHKVKDHPNHVMKVCPVSHRSNRVEFLVHWALSDMNADEYQAFGILECSRSGKYLVMERLPDLPPDFTGSRPTFPWWLVNTDIGCLGVTAEGRAKVRSYAEVRLGDVLAGARLKVFP